MSEKFVRDLNRLVRKPRTRSLDPAPARGPLPGGRYVAEPVAGDPPQNPPSGAGAATGEYVELYVVASQVVTDPTATWEMPAGFPVSNSYPGQADGPDQGVYLISERYHEMAVIDVDGNVLTLRHAIVFEQPYTGDASYSPAWYKRQATAPPGFEAAFAGVDWAQIDSDLQARYPGITL